MFNRIKTPLTLAGVSAGIMYLFDPDLGKRRRSLLRDKLTHFRNTMRKAVDISVRDMGHRLYGTFCELRTKLRGGDTSDGVVVDRVRSKIGRYTSHPSSIEVHVRNGRITLNGPILADEVAALVSAVKSVDGVREVDNLLEVHESREDTSALQGGVHRTGEPAEWMQAKWSPTARFIAGTAGAVLMINCLAKRTPPAITLGTAGFFFFLRAVTDQPIARLAAFGTCGMTDARIAKAHPAQARYVPAGPNTPQLEVERETSLASANRRKSTDELIDEASMESFPASDAPSFMRR
jgi:hypothetical protein